MDNNREQHISGFPTARSRANLEGMSANAEGRTLSRQQAAMRAAVTYQTIQLWERAGRLHAVEVSGSYEQMILVSELDQAAARSTTLDPRVIWRPEELAPHTRSA